MKHLSYACLLFLSFAISGCSNTNALRIATFAELSPDKDAARGYWSTEEWAAKATWADWEKRTLQLADLQVGSVLGVPMGGLTARSDTRLEPKPVQLHWRKYRHRNETRGGVVISVGFTEGLTMYQEVIYDLVNNGYSVYIQDHRGQGFSTRLAQGNLGHIHRFENFITDLDAFIASVAQERSAQTKAPFLPLFGLSHSMGGAILAGVLERQGATSPLSAAAFFTPMFEPAAAANPNSVLGKALQNWCHRGASDVQLPTSLATRKATADDFETQRDAFLQSKDKTQNDLTHSVPRLLEHLKGREAICDTPVHCGHNNAIVSGPSLQWGLQACYASAEIRGVAARQISRPVLVFSGGQDTIVRSEAQAEFCAQVNAASPGSCTGWLLPGARHALLMELDGLRKPAMETMLQFFDAAPIQTP